MSLLKIALAGGIVTALAAGGAFMFWPQSSAEPDTPKPQAVAESPPVPRIRAKIIVQLPGGVSCSLGAFDNTTGRVSDLSDASDGNDPSSRENSKIIREQITTRPSNPWMAAALW